MSELSDGGFAYLDFLTAVDRIDQLDVVAHLVDVESGEHVLLSTTIPADAPLIDSLVEILPGASWHERETAEMFGISFSGHPDPRPLLLRMPLGRPPLRKSVVLAARSVLPWPGAAEPEAGEDGRKAGNPSRRRQRPPGVPDGWLEDAP